MTSSPSSFNALQAPTLPYELIVVIVEHAWLDHDLSVKERMRMLSSFSLVNTSFAWEFTLLTLTHVHILSTSHFGSYFRRTRNRDSTFLLSKFGQNIDASRLARSITTHLCMDPARPKLPHPMTERLEALATALPTKLPNVHRFGVVYHDWITNDDQLAHMPLPSQIKVLSVAHLMDPSLPARYRDRYYKTVFTPEWRWGKPLPQLPHIKHLDVYGGNGSLTADLTKSCPNVATVTHNCRDLRLNE